MANTAAIYLRSSKDRSDMSPAVQRRELTEFAAERGYTLVAEYADVVVSGKNEHRPGFQALLSALRDERRGWDTILMVDTSRLARNQYVAHFFRHECERRGVQVLFAKTPEMDGIAGILLPAILHALDEVHSYLSREKGLAGMGENVRAGYRAGGRAPMGYQLREVETGAVRDGTAVTKTVLEMDPDLAPAMTAYLVARANGVPRRLALEQSGLPDTQPSTLVGIEWNALTYAGQGVWNVNAPRDPAGGYVGGSKRRPREEWVVQPDAHPALISLAQAETILQRLEKRAAARTKTSKVQRQDRIGQALLSGLLYTPGGEKWWSESDRYRLKRDGRTVRTVSRTLVEPAVISQVLADIQHPSFADALLDGTRRSLASAYDPDAAKRLQVSMRETTRRIDALLDRVPDLPDPSPILRKVADLEAERAAAEATLASARADAELAARAQAITSADVQQALTEVAIELQNDERPAMQAVLMSLVERVELDPETLQGSLQYRIAVDPGVVVASPRGFEPRSQP